MNKQVSFFLGLAGICFLALLFLYTHTGESPVEEVVEVIERDGVTFFRIDDFVYVTFDEFTVFHLPYAGQDLTVIDGDPVIIKMEPGFVLVPIDETFTVYHLVPRTWLEDGNLRPVIP